MGRAEVHFKISTTALKAVKERRRKNAFIDSLVTTGF